MISLIIEITYYSVLFLLAIKSVFDFKKYGFAGLKFLNVYIIVTACLEIYSYVLLNIDVSISTGILYNFYCLFSIGFFYFFYRKIFEKLRKRSLDIIFTASLLVYFGFTKFYKTDFDITIGVLISLFYIIVSLLWFYQKIMLFDENKITSDPVFWISTAILMWSCFFVFRSVPMFLFNKIDPEFLKLIRVNQNIINIIMYALLYVGMKKYENKIHLNPNDE